MSIGMASPNEQPQLVAFNKKDTNKMSKTVKLIYKSPAERYGNQFDIALIVITCLAFATRFWKLSHPDEIVFDEVHVGKFASYYLRQQYFFDVHPPFGKLLFAFIGWLVGFDGSFMFEKIGISYSKDKIPYVAYRSLPAFLSSCTLPIIFLTMKEAGYSLPASILSASIVLFDNAHICFSRLILLDAMLIFAIMCTIYSYIMFYKQRHSPFSYSWWKWLFLIGVALSSTISIKYIGVFTFMTIGVAVIINLWDLLGIERGQSIFIFIQHIIYRLFCLIIIPFVIYLFWFYIHFEILKNSSPGDAFMTTEFRDTLQNSSLVKQGLAVHYYDKITLKHIDTNAFLHSHPQRYPVRYENGRVSSNGQQVTAVPFEDKNNIWIVLPEKDENEQRLGYPVKYNDTVRFLHVSTQTILLAHNVASPLYITNPEFTTVPLDQATERHPYTLFQLRPTHNKAEDIVYTKLGILNVIHTFANVAMWTHNDVYLPKWGFGQQEVNGNTDITNRSNHWMFNTIMNMNDSSRLNIIVNATKRMNFFKKWIHLQMKIFSHNNALIKKHPYGSHPITWPLGIGGIACWSKKSDKKQIYFHGNVLGWWLECLVLVIFVLLVVADRILLKRKCSLLKDSVRYRLYTSSGFFGFAWTSHYLPFFIMKRQLFLHHYLPAHLCLALFTGTIFDFLLGLTHYECALKQATYNAKKPYSDRNNNDRTNDVYNQRIRQAWLISMSIVIALAGTYIYFSPLTYGDPGLSGSDILKRRILGFKL